MKATAGGFAGIPRSFADAFIPSASIPRKKQAPAFSGVQQVSALLQTEPGESHSFRQIWERLSPERKKTLQENFGENTLQEIESLSQEQDPTVFFRGLREIGRRLEEDKRNSAALEIYQFLETHASVEAVVREASDRVQAFHGGGSRAVRAELFLNRVGEEAGNPAVIAGFGVASTLYRLSRLGMMAQLVSRPAAFWTRGWAAEAAAGLFGLGWEAPGFVLGTKAAESLMGEKPDWNGDTLRREFALAYGTFLPLKISGAVFEKLAGRFVTAEDLFSRFSRAALPQAGMWVGILGGMGLASSAGLRPSAGQAWFAESLETLFHFNLGGLMSRRLLGTDFYRFERRIDLHTEMLSRGKTGGHFPLSFQNLFAPEWVTPEGFSLSASQIQHPTSKDPKTEGLFFMKGQGPGEGKTPFPKHLDSPTVKDSLRSLIEIYGPDPDLIRTLTGTRIEDAQIFDAGLRRILHAARYSSTTNSSGTYVNNLSRFALESAVRKNSSDNLDVLLTQLFDGGSLTGFEKSLAPQLPPARLPSWTRLLPDSLRSGSFAEQWIDPLPFQPEAKHILFRWALAQKKVSPEIVPGPAVEDSLGRLAKRAWHPAEQEAFEAALQFSAESPLALFRIPRILRIVQANDGLTLSKLREMADRHFHLQGFSPSRWHFLTLLGAHPLKLKNTQYDAYLDHPAPLLHLHEIKKRWPKLLDAAATEKRAEIRRKKLATMVAPLKGKTALDKEDVVRAFRTLADPYSLRIAREITLGKFEFKIAEGKDYAQLVHDYDVLIGEAKEAPQEPEELGPAYYYPAGTAGPLGVMLLRSPNLGAYSEATLADLLFETLGPIVHEYKHHLDMDPQNFRSREIQFREELMANAMDYLWRAEHGDTRMLEKFNLEGHAGFALHYRDKFESWYPLTY